MGGGGEEQGRFNGLAKICEVLRTTGGHARPRASTTMSQPAIAHTSGAQRHERRTQEGFRHSNRLESQQGGKAEK